jgi:hypothetical protein
MEHTRLPIRLRIDRMSHFDLSAEQSSRVELTRTSGLADVKLTHPYGRAYLVPATSGTAVQEQGKRVNGRIVLVLTIACILFVIFDLCLLAWGS